MRKNRTILLIGLGLLLALISRAGSGALSQVVADRNTNAATTVSDCDGILDLTGFKNCYVLTTSYAVTGTIVNNSNKPLQLRLYIDPDITLAKRYTGNQDVNWTLSFRLYRNCSACTTCNFKGTGRSHPAGIWTPRYQILPGGTFTVQTSMKSTSRKGYRFAAETSFIFDALGADGFSIYIEDTPSSPRNHSYTSVLLSNSSG